MGDDIDFNPFEYYNYIGPQEKYNRQIPDRLKNVHVCLVAKEDDDNEGSQVVYIWRITR